MKRIGVIVAAAIVAALVGLGVFAGLQALTTPAAWVKTSGEVTSVETVSVADESGTSPTGFVDKYRTVLVVEEATDGKVWTLTRTLSKDWPVGTDLTVYEITNRGEPLFDLAQPRSGQSLTYRNVAAAAFFTLLASFAALFVLLPVSAGGSGGFGPYRRSSNDGGAALTATTAGAFISIM